jgi:hypothetical protein
MNKTIAAACVGLILSAAAAPALARVKHHRHVTPARAAQSRINSGAAWSAGAGYQNYDPPWTFACIKDHGTSRCNDLN